MSTIRQGNGTRYRPQLPWCTLQQRDVHRKRQPRLATACAAVIHGQSAQAQRIVQVGRMHTRALLACTCTQPRRCHIGRTAPRLHECAVAGAVLQARRIKTVVQPPDVCCERRCALRRVVDGLPSVAADSRSGAVLRWRGLNGVGLATANLKVAVRDCGLDEQIGRLHGERLQKVHATQC